MAYKQKSNGGFRMRASFPVTPELVVRANRVCESMDYSMYELCHKALDAYVSALQAEIDRKAVASKAAA